MTRKRRKSNKDVVGGVIAAACIVGIILIFAFGTQGDFITNLKNIWYNTIDHVGEYATVDKAAEELADMEMHGDELIVYAIDTGNSDSILIRTPDGHSMLVDAADSDDFTNISGTLKALEIETLDAVVATHPDADHIGSMDRVVKSFAPATVYMTDNTKDTATYQRMLEAIEQSNAQAVRVVAPMEFMLGDVKVTALSPQNKEYEDANESSIVLCLEYGNSKFLLTGDAERDAIADMLALYPEYLDVDVLKVGHHGSTTSTTQELLSAATPQIGVITCGKDNDYGHPHKETLALLDQNGVTVLRTDEDGDVAVFSDGDAVEYATAA